MKDGVDIFPLKFSQARTREIINVRTESILKKVFFIFCPLSFFVSQLEIQQDIKAEGKKVTRQPAEVKMNRQSKSKG